MQRLYRIDTTEVYATLIHILQRHVCMFCNDTIEFYRHHGSLCDTCTCSAKTRIHVLQRHYRILLDTVEFYATLMHVVQKHVYMFCMRRQDRILPAPLKSIRHVYMFCKEFHKTPQKSMRHSYMLCKHTYTCSAKSLWNSIQHYMMHCIFVWFIVCLYDSLFIETCRILSV